MATLMSMMMGTFLFLLLGGLLIYVYMTRVRTSRSKFGLGASDMSLGFNDFGKRNKVDMIFGVRDTIIDVWHYWIVFLGFLWIWYVTSSTNIFYG